MKMYNLKAGDGVVLVTYTELSNYYSKNKDTLMSLKYENIPVTLLSNYDGYCTTISHKGNIIQGWAGEFTAG